MIPDVCEHSNHENGSSVCHHIVVPYAYACELCGVGRVCETSQYYGDPHTADECKAQAGAEDYGVSHTADYGKAQAGADELIASIGRICPHGSLKYDGCVMCHCCNKTTFNRRDVVETGNLFTSVDMTNKNIYVGNLTISDRDDECLDADDERIAQSHSSMRHVVCESNSNVEQVYVFESSESGTGVSLNIVSHTHQTYLLRPDIYDVCEHRICNHDLESRSVICCTGIKIEHPSGVQDGNVTASPQDQTPLSCVSNPIDTNSCVLGECMIPDVCEHSNHQHGSSVCHHFVVPYVNACEHCWSGRVCETCQYYGDPHTADSDHGKAQAGADELVASIGGICSQGRLTPGFNVPRQQGQLTQPCHDSSLYNILRLRGGGSFDEAEMDFDQLCDDAEIDSRMDNEDSSMRHV